MGQMSKYSVDTTENHPLVRDCPCCFENIKKIIKREGFHSETNEQRCEDYKRIPFKNAKVINLDCIAIERKKNNKTLKSVDIVFGLDNDKFLFVELKLNVERVPLTRKTKDLRKKKDHSKKLMNIDENDLEDSILVYCNTSKTKNYLRKIRKEKPQPSEYGYKIMILEELKRNYFLEN